MDCHIYCVYLTVCVSTHIHSSHVCLNTQTHTIHTHTLKCTCVCLYVWKHMWKECLNTYSKVSCVFKHVRKPFKHIQCDCYPHIVCLKVCLKVYHLYIWVFRCLNTYSKLNTFCVKSVYIYICKNFTSYTH